MLLPPRLSVLQAPVLQALDGVLLDLLQDLDWGPSVQGVARALLPQCAYGMARFEEDGHPMARGCSQSLRIQVTADVHVYIYR